ncbi:hypothetical protein Cadr_000018786 [Camelus dromedarius]|uniref:Secreted protein n=1 Tax=Camelus dromedarius TaxID=9838 RepID=A0A5N4D352_CAMDR|nr:hypothetical protein Cadr_000018786 [Camelus dromedarius]
MTKLMLLVHVFLTAVMRTSSTVTSRASFSFCCVENAQSKVRARRASSRECGRSGSGTCTDLSVPHAKKIWCRSYMMGSLLTRKRFSVRM